MAACHNPNSPIIDETPLPKLSAEGNLEYCFGDGLSSHPYCMGFKLLVTTLARLSRLQGWPIRVLGGVPLGRVRASPTSGTAQHITIP